MCHQQQQRLYPSLEEFSPVSSSLEGQGIPLPSAPRLELSDQSKNSSSLEGQGIPLPSAPCLEEFDDWTLDELDWWLQDQSEEFSSSLEGQGIPLPSAPRLEFSDQSTNSSSLEGQGIPLPSAPCLEEFDDWTLDELDYWLQANNKTVCPMTRVQYPSVKVQWPKPKLGPLNKLKKFFGIPQVRKSYSITKW